MRYVLIGIMLAAGAAYAQDTFRWTDTRRRAPSIPRRSPIA